LSLRLLCLPQLGSGPIQIQNHIQDNS